MFPFPGGGSGSSSMSRGEMSLAEVQCHLDKEGASNLVIDLIMNASSDRVFHESILLAIALLEGGNTTIQVGRRVASGVAVLWPWAWAWACVWLQFVGVAAGLSSLPSPGAPVLGATDPRGVETRV